MNYTLEYAIDAINDRTRGLIKHTEDEYDELEDIIQQNKNINIDDEIELLKNKKKEIKQQEKEKKQEEKQQEKEIKQQEKQQEKEKKQEEKQQEKEKKQEKKQRIKDTTDNLTIDNDLAKIYIILNKDNFKVISKNPNISYLWCDIKKLWLVVDKFTILKPIHEVLNKYMKETIKDNDVLVNVVKILGNDTKLRAIYNQVYIETDIHINFESELLNKSTYELPIKNGYKINIKTLETEKRTIKDYFSFELSVDFIGNKYNKDIVHKFILDISNGNIELFEYHKKLWGYFLSGDILDRSFYIFHGHGCNGKSSLINIFKAITKNYTAQLSPTAIMKKRTTTSLSPELISLMTARTALLPESEKGEELNIKFIKSITGGDTQNCRGLYKNEEEFKSQSKLILATNFKPDIKDDTKAIWDRIKLIPFNATFQKTSDNSKYIENITKDNLDDFFTFFCYGAREYFKDGFNTCSIIDEAIKEYKSSSNIYLCFINEMYEYIQINEYTIMKDEDKNKWLLPRTTVYEDFIKWCDNDNNRENKNITRTSFYIEIRKLIGEQKKSLEYFTCKYKNLHINSTFGGISK